MPFVSTGHIWLLLIVLVVVLIIWGPGKLPDVGSGLGRAIREFRKSSSDTRNEFSKASHEDSAPAAVRAEPFVPSPVVAPPAPAVPVPSAPAYPPPFGSSTVPGPPPVDDPR